eukprot:6212022-Pleurochrysis_carterae.AAC.3
MMRGENALLLGDARTGREAARMRRRRATGEGAAHVARQQHRRRGGSSLRCRRGNARRSKGTEASTQRTCTISKAEAHNKQKTAHWEQQGTDAHTRRKGVSQQKSDEAEN